MTIIEKNIKERAHPTKVPLEVKTRVFNAVQYYWDLLRTKGYAVGSYPSVGFDLQGSSAGQAFSGLKHIVLNPKYLLANLDNFIEDVIPHELAHIANTLLFDGKGHDASWKKIAIWMGSSGSVRHRMTAPNIRKTITYVCGCQKHEVTVRLHNNMLRGKVYQCKRCKKELTLKK